MSKIYVASSWRNVLHPAIVQIARGCGHDVYDFRNPRPGNRGFNWKELGLDHGAEWTAEQMRNALRHPIAREGYGYDIAALHECEIVILVLPAGRSANWEFGFAMGQGKRGIVCQFSPAAPELMYSQAEIVGSANELFDALGGPDRPHAPVNDVA